MSVTKRAEERHGFRREIFSFDSARAAIQAYLADSGVGSGDPVLLPSYVGWTARQGSGVHDPVLARGARACFYRIREDLSVDLDFFEEALRRHRPKVVILIHYFGFPDVNLPALVQLAGQHSARVIEDEAHAFLSDWIGGICGRFGDAAVVSLHKLLPVDSGGLLVLNAGSPERLGGLSSLAAPPTDPIWGYDLSRIALRRRANAALLLRELAAWEGLLDPLFPALPEGVVPQSLPVTVPLGTRDDLYHEANARGFGVVSLYHTLVDRVDPARFPEAYRLSRRILNLPVHQDAEPEQLRDLVTSVGGMTRHLSRGAVAGA